MVAELSRKNVVLVDDKPDIRLVLATRLSVLPDLTVVGQGGDGAEAITLARDLRPDAMILDLQMPVMTGWEAIPILRAMAPAVRILVFSAFTDVDHHLSRWAKPDANVAKGAELGVLVDELRKLLCEQPDDIVSVSLGRIPVSEAMWAYDSWVGFNLRVRDAIEMDSPVSADQLGGALPADLLALVGIMLQLGEQLVHAGQSGQTEVELQLRSRRDAAQAARRSLLSIEDADIEDFYRAWNHKSSYTSREGLKLMRSRLADALPVG